MELRNNLQKVTHWKNSYTDLLFSLLGKLTETAIYFAYVFSLFFIIF